jgi:molybdate transport system substrate-binding protein
MIRRLARNGLIWALLGVVLVGGCARESEGPNAPVNRDPNVIVAYVACGMAPAIQVAKERFEATNPGKSVRMEVGQPPELVARIEQGGVPDILICPGDSEIGMLERAGLLDPAAGAIIGHYGVAIATSSARPIGLSRPEDLAGSGVESIAMATPGINSVGSDGKHALERVGLWDQVQSKLVLCATPLEAVTAVAEGEASAALIYDPCPVLQLPDLVPPDSVTVVATLNPGEQRSVKIRLGVHRRSPNQLLVRRFVEVINSEELRPELAEVGLPGL